MKKIIIAFDIDGTLIRNDSDGDMDKGKPIANERIRSLLITLASFKNVHIIVWSGGGELYTRQVCLSLGLDKYIDEYASKNLIKTDKNGKHIFKPDIVPDIVIDDIQDCELGNINLIVREK